VVVVVVYSFFGKLHTALLSKNEFLNYVRIEDFLSITVAAWTKE
jgi:hypothetical protein